MRSWRLGPRHAWPADRVPPAVQLVVAVNGQAIVEARKHGFTPGIDSRHDVAGQSLLETLELRQAEVNGFDRVVDQHSCDLVRRQAYFRPLGHR